MGAFVITGASRGIGRALSERLARAGKQVVGLARREDATFPGELISVDLSDGKATADVVSSIAARHRISAVVNNVASVRAQSLHNLKLNDLSSVLDLNLRTAVQLTQAALPAMTEDGWGRIVNIASLVVLGVPERSSYAAAKAALVSFTRSWALEFAETGVTVNAVAPGPVETELFRTQNPVGSDGERWYRNLIPMKRLGRPDDVAAAIQFFLSEESSFITGQTLFVDGGASIGKASV